MENPAQQSQPEERVGDDLSIGARAIANELGVTLSAVYYLHRKRLFPIGRLGKTLIASRRKLQRAALTLTS
jgi:hypothetical protein